MPFSRLVLFGGGALFLALLAWWAFFRLRPAWRTWRKERRLLRACNQAFGEENYRLQRLRLPVSSPSFFEHLFGLAEPPKRHYTYQIFAVGDQEPDFSKMSRRDIALVRHYLGSRHMTHNGREAIHEPPSATVENA